MAIFDITWQKNGVPIPPGTNPSFSASPNALTLAFDTWSVSDSGVYECVVSTRIRSFNSSIPRVISTVTNLTVASESEPEVVRVVGGASGDILGCDKPDMVDQMT